MPQVLKDELKQQILEAARQEFLEKGFTNASMRNIAARSGLSVGNLYRYFKNKDDLSDFIVNGVFSEINELINRLASLDMEQENSELKYDSLEELALYLDELSESLVDIFNRHKIEFNILMMDSSLNERMAKWFAGVISKIILSRYPRTANYVNEVNLLSESYAVSVFAGAKNIFKKYRSVDYLAIVIRVYLRSYVSILKADLIDLTGDKYELH